MCSLEQSIVLSQSENVQISWCKGCKSFSVTYQSTCASFSEDELDVFSHVLEYLNQKDYRFFILDKWHAIIKSPSASVGFCLTEKDTQALKGAIKEAKTMYDVFSIVYNPVKKK